MADRKPHADQEQQAMANEDITNLSAQEVYARLTPEQRAALAEQFQAGLQQSDHPEAQQLAQVPPQEATAEQLAQMHEHAATHNKGLLGVVLAHPVATAALGAFAIYELDKHLGSH
jgi:hypothetical protein